MTRVVSHRACISLLVALLAGLGLVAALVGGAAAAPTPADERARQPDAPAITLTKTVSLDGSCGVTDIITASWATAVTYCYSVVNLGDVTFTTHTLTDTHLDTILLDFPLVLVPGASSAVTATWDPPNLFGLIENCARWQASSPDGAGASADDCAAVFIIAPTDVSLVELSVGQSRATISIAAAVLALISLGSLSVLFRRVRRSLSGRRPGSRLPE